MLTACGNVSESVESAEISAVNQTTVTVTSVKEEKDTSETATTTRKSSQTVSETSLAKTTTKVCNHRRNKSNSRVILRQ